MRAMAMIALVWSMLVACVALARADAPSVVVESPAPLYVPELCYVGPRTAQVMEWQCGGDMACYAAKLDIVCAFDAVSYGNGKVGR